MKKNRCTNGDGTIVDFEWFMPSENVWYHEELNLLGVFGCHFSPLGLQALGWIYIGEL